MINLKIIFTELDKIEDLQGNEVLLIEINKIKLHSKKASFRL
jgi:hypothetical protein